MRGTHSFFKRGINPKRPVWFRTRFLTGKHNRIRQSGPPRLSAIDPYWLQDWGRMIEGHGGILDRMDSVSFASPLFFHLTRYWFAA